MDWLRSRDVSIRVDETGLFNLLPGLLHRLALVHHHGVRASACWDDHGSEGASSLDTFIVHDVLRVVLSITQRRLEKFDEKMADFLKDTYRLQSASRKHLLTVLLSHRGP
jgi:hypothetical protein